MAAADVNTDLRDFCHLPNVEVVQLTVSDGETYMSRKFATILGAIATGNQDNDAHLNVTFTAKTATINYAGMTDQLVTLVLFGIK